MYMSIRTYRVSAAQRSEVVRRVDEDWTDELRQQKGVLTYYVVEDGQDGLVSVTACEDEEALNLAVDQSARWVGGHLMDLDVTLLEERRGPVVSHLGT